MANDGGVKMPTIRFWEGTYKVSNETARRVAGGRWEQIPSGELARKFADALRNGRLIPERGRLRLATVEEEAIHRIRSGDDVAEIVRGGFLIVSARLEAIANEVRTLRETLAFDSDAASHPIARDVR
jgi:hypothetical protein